MNRLATASDKKYAKGKVSHAVAAGLIPIIHTQSCMDCSRPAQEYDHARGYDSEHVLDIEPVCRKCHKRREKGRGRTGKRAPVIHVCFWCFTVFTPTHRAKNGLTQVFCGNKCRGENMSYRKVWR